MIKALIKRIDLIFLGGLLIKFYKNYSRPKVKPVQAAKPEVSQNSLDNLNNEFPIDSQTSPTDKLSLIKIRDIFKKTLPSYSYLEIGSYLGGSLTPFLQDSQCSHILSIDERNRQQPDERGAKYDYVGITHQTMIDNLISHKFNVNKLETFDGSVSEYKKTDKKYDLVFIDGEHTDWACFRDFIHSRKLLKENCVILFHDSDLIYKSLKIIQELLIASNEKFKFIKIKDSFISCVFLNDYSSLKLDDIFLIETDLNSFYANCENTLLMENVKRRVKFDVNFSLKEIPIEKRLVISPFK